MKTEPVTARVEYGWVLHITCDWIGFYARNSDYFWDSVTSSMLLKKQICCIRY